MATRDKASEQLNEFKSSQVVGIFIKSWFRNIYDIECGNIILIATKMVWDFKKDQIFIYLQPKFHGFINKKEMYESWNK